MDMLSRLSDPQLWQEYYTYKHDSGRLFPWEDKQLQSFIREKQYLSVVESILRGESFPPPKRSEISKMSSDKKRIVYTFPSAHNYVLKLLTYRMLRDYDYLFAPNLYSFRAKVSARDAIIRLTSRPGIAQMYSYKADISNYFNSIPVDKLLPLLQRTLSDDPRLYHFLEDLLTQPLVNNNGTLMPEEKGIMAGAPISTFLANLYLAHMDAHFAAAGKIYARYSDDIILFAPTLEELEADQAWIRQCLADAGLTMNPRKELRTVPGEPWVFLGFCYHEGKIDIAPASVEKLLAKMRRKSRALMRWKDKNEKEGPHAARAFIKVFNRKLFETTAEHDLTWARWYFPTISTADSLQVIDHYAQSCIRYLYTGTRTKAAYNCRYEDMKALGYISLVNQFYKQQCGHPPDR